MSHVIRETPAHRDVFMSRHDRPTLHWRRPASLLQRLIDAWHTWRDR